MILAFFYLRGKWLLNWPIIYSGLVVFRPPPGSAAKCRGSLRNKKTPPMGEALTSPHKRGYPLAVPDMNDHGRFEQRYERFARALTEYEQDKYVNPIELKVVKDFVKNVVPIALYNDVQNNPIEPRDFDEIYHIQQSGSVLIPVYQDMGFFERRYSRFVQSMNAPITQFLHPSERKAVTEYLTFVQQNTITSKDFARIDALIHTDTKSVNRGDGWFIVALNAYMNGTYMHPSQTTVVNAYVKYARARDEKLEASAMSYN